MNDCYCYWFKPPEGSLKHADLTMSHPAFNHPWAPCSLRKLLVPSVHHAASHLHAFTHAAPPAQIALLLLHLANSSFKTPLRGQLQEAFPAPPRLGKMRPVCVFIIELTTCIVSFAHVCVLPLDCLPPGQGPDPSVHRFSPSFWPHAYHAECLPKCLLNE